MKRISRYDINLIVTRIKIKIKIKFQKSGLKNYLDIKNSKFKIKLNQNNLT